MAIYKDYSFDIGSNGLCQDLSGTNAVINAIKNIILSRKGNFPFTPDLGINIAKYQFELFDSFTLLQIKNELMQQVNKFIPAIDNVDITVSKLEEEINGKSTPILGIGITAVYAGEVVQTNYLVYKDKEEVYIKNETY